MIPILSSSSSSASAEDLDLNAFFYPDEEMSSSLPLPPEQLQILMEYLPCAFDQYSMRRVNKEWCYWTTNLIEHQNTVSVEDARAFLKTAIDQLKAKPETAELHAIVALETLSEELEGILNSQRLFGPRQYIEVIDRFDKIIYRNCPLQTAEALIQEVSQIPKSKMANFYSQILKSGTNHNSFFWDRSLNQKKEVEICVLDLAKVGYTSNAISAAHRVCDMWYNGEQFSCPSFGVVAHQQLLKGDVQGAHKTLDRSDSLRMKGFDSFNAVVDQARKELYIQLISYKFNDIAIELSQKTKAHNKFITPAAEALILAFIECGQPAQAFDVILDSEWRWNIDTQSMKQEYAMKIIKACLSSEDASEENLNLAIEAAKASGSMLFLDWTLREVENKRSDKK